MARARALQCDLSWLRGSQIKKAPQKNWALEEILILLNKCNDFYPSAMTIQKAMDLCTSWVMSGKNSAVWTEISAKFFVNMKSLFFECSVFAKQHYWNGNKKNTVPGQNVAWQIHSGRLTQVGRFLPQLNYLPLPEKIAEVIFIFISHWV